MRVASATLSSYCADPHGFRLFHSIVSDQNIRGAIEIMKSSSFIFSFCGMYTSADSRFQSSQCLPNIFMYLATGMERITAGDINAIGD